MRHASFSHFSHFTLLRYKQTTTEGYHERLFLFCLLTINAHRKLYTHHVTYRFLSSLNTGREADFFLRRDMLQTFFIRSGSCAAICGVESTRMMQNHRHRVGWHNHFYESIV